MSSDILESNEAHYNEVTSFSTLLSLACRRMFQNTPCPLSCMNQSKYNLCYNICLALPISLFGLF